MSLTVPRVLAARTPLAFLPTPMHPLDSLSAALGGRVRIWIKRDDQTGLATGGNKARKLEYLIHAAKAAGATVLVTGGAVQSNHARQTAAAAAAVGLGCVLALVPGALATTDYRESGNALLDEVLGAEVRRFPAGTAAADAIDRVAADLLELGERPYVVPVGGSNALGSLGYVGCAAEITAAAESTGVRFGAVVTATGSGGTQAGLLVGFGDGAPPVVGVSVASPTAQQRATVAAIAADTALLLGRPAPHADAVIVDDRFVGPGYGVPTDAMREAVLLLARTEGVLADPVYTGKALAALVHAVRAAEGPIGTASDVLFLHTGGQAGLFAYRQEFES